MHVMHSRLRLLATLLPSALAQYNLVVIHSSPLIRYTGHWESNAQYHYTSQLGAAASITFTGQAVSWFSSQSPRQGLEKVTLASSHIPNGRQSWSVNAKGSSREGVESVVFQEWVEPDEYTITIEKCSNDDEVMTLWQFGFVDPAAPPPFVPRITGTTSTRQQPPTSSGPSTVAVSSSQPVSSELRSPSSATSSDPDSAVAPDDSKPISNSESDVVDTFTLSPSAAESPVATSLVDSMTILETISDNSSMQPLSSISSMQGLSADISTSTSLPVGPSRSDAEPEATSSVLDIQNDPGTNEADEENPFKKRINRGLAIGAAILGAVLLGLLFFLWSRKRRARDSDEHFTATGTHVASRSTTQATFRQLPNSSSVSFLPQSRAGQHVAAMDFPAASYANVNAIGMAHSSDDYRPSNYHRGSLPINYARPLAHSTAVAPELPPAYPLGRSAITPQDLAVYVESSSASVHQELSDKMTKAA